MWVDAASLQDPLVRTEVAVIGAGPAGIVTALDLARNGVDVALIESGGRRFSGRTQELGTAHTYDETRHAPMHECTRRQLGGASIIWGGRCVPYDPIDFESRSYVPRSDWPVRYDEIEAYFERTCDYFRCGRAVFDIHEIDGIAQRSIVPGLPDGDVLSSNLERWSLPTNFGAEYGKELENHPRIRVVAGLTCTEIDVDTSSCHVIALLCRSLSSPRVIRVKARAYVIACGGIESTRLLLASSRVHRGGIGNHADHLGRYYMGHISGRIAHAHFTTPSRQTVYGIDRDEDGTYIRRRFSFSSEFQRDKQLLNIVASPANPDIADPTHRNGVLSFAYLALMSPLGRFFASEALRKSAVGSHKESHWVRHVRNIMLDPWRTLYFVPTFGYQRFVARRKVPGFYQYSAGNTYPLHYHGEQIPNPDSRVTLADEVDEFGMPQVDIDLRYSDQDVDSVVRAHHHWNEYLRLHDVGYLEYMAEDLEASVWEQATDGFHQAGTTRMSAAPGDGVVDPQCRVHGIENLFVASSSNFVTSGQANSTFMIVAFALRLADHLRETTLEKIPAID